MSGSIDGLIAQPIALAADKDVYLDGGTSVRQGLEAGLADDRLRLVRLTTEA